MENEAKTLLTKKRDLEAEGRFLHAKMKDGRRNSKLKERPQEVDEQLARIENWLLLLTEDEAHVITRHLIDGIDLARVAVEYKERWGEDFSKTERTLKSYQRKALLKIARFEKQNEALINGE